LLEKVYNCPDIRHIPAIGLIIASAFTLAAGTSSGFLPICSTKAFWSARMAVSILTWALPALVSETYPLLETFRVDVAATLGAELRKRPADEPGCFKQSREACRNVVAAKVGMLMVIINRIW
jgi:hypothetical protein